MVYSAKMSGRAFNGAHRDAGKIVHLVRENYHPSWDIALCGKRPGLKGNGWHFITQVTEENKCKKCEQVELHEMNTRIKQEIREHENENSRVNNRILRAIKSCKSNGFYLAIKKVMKDIEDNGYGRLEKMSLVKSSRGDKQSCDFRPIKNEWVDQHPYGDGGDSFFGDVYIQLKENLWLKIPFTT